MPDPKIVLVLGILCCSAVYAHREEETVLELTVLYNNVSCDTLLKTDWGFACLVSGTEKVILFDTGGDGKILLENMQKKGIDPGSIEVLILSHIHGDHTGGVRQLLQKNSDIIVYVPASFPEDFTDQVGKLCADVIEIREPMELMCDVWTTGEMGSQIKEQGLILKTVKGCILITGCAHPGIVDMVSRAKEVAGDSVYLATGGFHLLRAKRKETESIIEKLKEMGVKKVAPSHCTGEEQIRLFSEKYGDNFIPGGCGAVIRVPES